MARVLKLLREIRANIIRRPTFVESGISVVNISRHSDLAHGAQPSPLSIKGKDAQRLAGAMLFRCRKAMPDADGSVCLKDEEGVGIVAARVYEVIDIVWPGTVILEVTA